MLIGKVGEKCATRIEKKRMDALWEKFEQRVEDKMDALEQRLEQKFDNKLDDQF